MCLLFWLLLLLLFVILHNENFYFWYFKYIFCRVFLCTVLCCTVWLHCTFHESELKTVTTSVSDTHRLLLPKVFISGCHLLQQVGDVIRHIRHLGTFTAVTDALEVFLRSNQETLTQKHGEAGGHGIRTRRREPDTRWVQIKIDVTEKFSGLWRRRVDTWSHCYP